jgi:hypothetical protein
MQNLTDRICKQQDKIFEAVEDGGDYMLPFHNRVNSQGCAQARVFWLEIVGEKWFLKRQNRYPVCINAVYWSSRFAHYAACEELRFSDG